MPKFDAAPKKSFLYEKKISKNLDLSRVFTKYPNAIALRIASLYIVFMNVIG